MNTKDLPIGYWIKQADELLTMSINEIHSSLGVTRTGWQVLHLLVAYENHELQKDLLANIMQPFAGQRELENIFNIFGEKNILTVKGNMVTLTGKGKLVHDQCFERQNAFRLKSVAGIPGENYQITVSTLQRIVSNLTEINNTVAGQ